MYSEQQRNIIIGLILGDGHLSLKGKAKNASLIVKRCAADADYSQYHCLIFKDHITSGGIKYKSQFDKRTLKYYSYVEYSLKAVPELTKIYHDWYNNKIKIIPKNLELNGEIIATWFCDDGTIKKSKNNYFDIQLSTNSFSKDEVIFLQKLLSDRYDSRIGICSAKNNRYIIHLSDYAVRKFIADIDPYFPKGMERKRKWKDVIFGKEHYSIKKSSDEKREKIKEFIKLNDTFSLIDVAKYLDWYFIRKNGSKELDTQNAKRYLEKYITLNVIAELPREIKNNFRSIYYKKTNNASIA